MILEACSMQHDAFAGHLPSLTRLVEAVKHHCSATLLVRSQWYGVAETIISRMCDDGRQAFVGLEEWWNTALEDANF
jgi:hypothetical protein